MMKRYVSVFGCVALMMAVADPASARSHRHHRHVSAFKHSHQYSWRTYTHVRHARHWRAHRGLVAAPPPYALNPEIAWQVNPQPTYVPAPRQQRVRQAVAVRPAWPTPMQPSNAVTYAAPSYGVESHGPAPVAAAPFATAPFGAASPGWQQPRVARVARSAAPSGAIPGSFASLVSQHAQANGLPESLVHRVIMRESRYNPRAVSRGNFGIMQIRLGTARAMGYRGSASGLLDPNTNMTYAVRYLAGAYRAAGGNHSRAVSYYARGYYHQAKRAGFSAYARTPSI
jgi:soluble lytic murein transglycosylase-like protein